MTDELLTDEIKDIARSMITASHYNNLPDNEFENYLQAIIAKVLKHRLDRPELREKIKDILCIKWAKSPPYDWEVDQILALIPDVEERFAEGIEHYRKVIMPVMVEEAKREERERIIRVAEEGMAELAGFTSREAMLTQVIMPDYWQALKSS